MFGDARSVWIPVAPVVRRPDLRHKNEESSDLHERWIDDGVARRAFRGCAELTSVPTPRRNVFCGVLAPHMNHDLRDVLASNVTTLKTFATGKAI